MKKSKDKKPSPIKKLRAKAAERREVHRKQSPHRTFRLTRRSEVPKLAPVPVWWRLFIQTIKVIFNQPRLFFGLIGIYVLLTWLVSGAYNTNFSDIKEVISLAGEGAVSSIEELSLLASGFITAQTNSLDTGSLVIINLLTVLFSLSFIWLARHQLAGKATTLRQALYTSGTAFVPVVLVIFALLVQLLPATISMLIVSNLGGNGFIQGPAEVFLFSILAALLAIVSLYFLASTVIALQIAALPGMYPWRALQNARRLTIGRRLNVLRKMVMLAIVLIIGWLIFFIPAILLDGIICGDATSCWSSITILPGVYYFLIGVSIAIAVTYTYLLYRALLEASEA